MSDRNAQGNGRGAEGAGAAGVRPGVWTGEAADAQANEDTQADMGARAGAGIRAGRRRRILRRAAVCTGLTAVVLALYLASILTGDGKAFGPGELIALLTGTPSQDAAFIIGEDRLPRATLGLLAGVAYGAGGVVFQTMLRNQLASPDVIGINAGASAFGVTAILVWHLDQSAVALVALAGALATAVAIYLLSYRGGFAGTRLILVGIGISSVLSSAVTYVLSKASMWDMQTASRWLTGSLNSATWKVAGPLALACAVLLPVLLAEGRNLNTMRLGDETASGLGIAVHATRMTTILCAVALVAVATSACGPIAFVAFMAGPIAARMTGPGASPLVPSALVGAALVLTSDYCGQHFFAARYPVGVITGVLGAPYLIYLLVRANGQGSSL